MYVIYREILVKRLCKMYLKVHLKQKRLEMLPLQN